MAREIIAGIRMGDWIAVSMVASNASYNPDIADDLARRTTFMFTEALNTMDEFDLIDHLPLEDEEGEEVKELDPRIVRFIQDGWEGNPDA
jgi:hypothetical protein